MYRCCPILIDSTGNSQLNHTDFLSGARFGWGDQIVGLKVANMHVTRQNIDKHAFQTI